MFGIFKKKQGSIARTLNHFSELMPNDLVTFKGRSILPVELQEQTLTVEKVQAYQYDDGLSPEFVLRLPSGNAFTVMCSDAEEEETLTISKRLSHEMVTLLFAMAELELLFVNEGEVVLNVTQDPLPDEFDGWVAQQYVRTLYDAVGYFYNEDRRSEGVSSYTDDNSEELRYHECRATPNEFSLNVEVWEDGSTDFFVQITVPQNVISEMWPNEQKD